MATTTVKQKRLLFQKQASFKHTAPEGGEGSYSHGYAHIYQGEQLGTLQKQ